MKTLLDFGVAADDRQRLLRGLHEGKYNLLLGAGASYGSKGGDGEELKDGITFSQQMAEKFNLKLNPDEAKKLPLTYEEAESTDSAALKKWLRGRFIGCTPTWQHLLFRIRWERIWTFNIDDVLDNAFVADQTTNVYKNLAGFNWKQNVSPVESTPESIQVVHLHGRAIDLGGKWDGLVFSTAQYLSAARGFQQWHASFQTHYLEDPFIICGASLAEEVDIAEAIRTKNRSRANGFPSFIVSYGLDDGQKERMLRYNLVPIVSPLEDFFKVLLNELREYQRTTDAIYSKLRPHVFERFLSQFRRLGINDSSTTAIEGTDFYGGDEPTWDDVLSDRDARFDTAQRAARVLDDSNRFAVLIHGDNVSGKSVALLRIAKTAMQKGYVPFWFRHQEGFNAESVAEYLSADEHAVLLIDDAASYVEAIGKALQNAKRKGHNARIFLTLRTPRLRGFRIDVDDEFRSEFKTGHLANVELARFVQKRRKVSRLGKHVSKSDSKIIKELAENCKSELLESLSYIEFSEPIRERVRKIVLDAINTESKRILLARIVCVHRFGFSLPLRVALMASGLQMSEFDEIANHRLKAEGALVRDANGLRLRHRILSEYAWTESFSIEERYAAMSDVTKCLAPLINPDVIRAKGIEHLILREVLDQSHVSKSIESRALEFYEEHEPELGWSSRYWDQRALLEAKIESHFTKAYSYSQKAISIERHPFAFTSLGTICMQHALRVFERNRTEALKFFFEGEIALTAAWSLSMEMGRPHEHPFVTFFAAARSLLRKLQPDDLEFESILQHHKIWLERAKDSTVYKGSFQQKRIREVEAVQMKETLRMRRVQNPGENDCK